MGLVVKELTFADKRLSTMITCLLVLVAQFLAQWMMSLYYLPLLDMMQKLT